MTFESTSSFGHEAEDLLHDSISEYRSLIEPARDTRTLPTHLAQRLRAIPDAVADVQAWQGVDAQGAAVDVATLDVLSALESARRPLALPAGLAERLRAMPSQSSVERLPRWITDSRWTTAACLLLTAALSLAAGDASATFQRSTRAVSQLSSGLSPGLSIAALSTSKTSLSQRVDAWRHRVLAPPVLVVGRQLTVGREHLSDHLSAWVESAETDWQSFSQDFTETSAAVTQWVTTALEKPTSTWTKLWSGDDDRGEKQ